MSPGSGMVILPFSRGSARSFHSLNQSVVWTTTGNAVAWKPTACMSRLKRLSTGSQFFIRSDGKMSWVTPLLLAST